MSSSRSTPGPFMMRSRSASMNGESSAGDNSDSTFEYGLRHPRCRAIWRTAMEIAGPRSSSGSVSSTSWARTLHTRYGSVCPPRSGIGKPRSSSTLSSCWSRLRRRRSRRRVRRATPEISLRVEAVFFPSSPIPESWMSDSAERSSMGVPWSSTRSVASPTEWVPTSIPTRRW